MQLTSIILTRRPPLPNATSGSKTHKVALGQALYGLSSVSSTVGALPFPLSRLRSSESCLDVSVDIELECPASIEKLPSPEFGGGAAMLVLPISEGPENSCEEPQLGSSGGPERSPVGVVEDVVLGTVVFGTIELPEADWSAIMDGGVWMAFVSDESADESCK